MCMGGTRHRSEGWFSTSDGRGPQDDQGTERQWSLVVCYAHTPKSRIYNSPEHLTKVDFPIKGTVTLWCIVPSGRLSVVVGGLYTTSKELDRSRTSRWSTDDGVIIRVRSDVSGRVFRLGILTFVSFTTNTIR